MSIFCLYKSRALFFSFNSKQQRLKANICIKTWILFCKFINMIIVIVGKIVSVPDRNGLTTSFWKTWSLSIVDCCTQMWFDLILVNYPKANRNSIIFVRYLLALNQNVFIINVCNKRKCTSSQFTNRNKTYIPIYYIMYHSCRDLQTLLKQ